VPKINIGRARGQLPIGRFLLLRATLPSAAIWTTSATRMSWRLATASCRLCFLHTADSTASPPPSLPSRSLHRGPMIRLKRIYNFWCSMLIFTPFALYFVILRGVFMRFLELTYWQDVTVPVPCFLLFLYFRKATQEIFSELDETSSKTPILPRRRTRTKREPERGQGPASPWGDAAQPLAAPTYGETTLVHSWRRPFAYKKPRDRKP
jgi:hypothetical protein